MFGFGFTAKAVARLILPASITSRNTPAQETAAALHHATHLLILAPPDFDGDPCLKLFAEEIAAAKCLRWVGYCSSVGIYGDREGQMVTEQSDPAPTQERSRLRLQVENAWRAIRPDLPLDLFRLAGIYGPGRSALDDLRNGKARRIVAPQHKFNRIHVDDAARAIERAILSAQAGTRILHLTDDFPTPSAEVVSFAAELLALTPPSPISLADAVRSMSPMARSFWTESRLVSNAATKKILGLNWNYPSYREGLKAILAEESGQQGQILRS